MACTMERLSLFLMHVLDERAIYFQPVDREDLEMRQRCIACPEVIESNCDAHGADAMQSVSDVG